MKNYTTTTGGRILALPDGRKVSVRSAHKDASGNYHRLRDVLKASNGMLYYVKGNGLAQRVEWRWVKKHAV